MADIWVTVNGRQVSLDAADLDMAFKERVLRDHPELLAALSDAGAAVSSWSVAPKVNDDGVYLNYIDGQWCAPAGADTHPNIDPSRKDN